jgi:hypothetical protein
MRIVSVCFSLLAIAVCAGCAQQSRTTEMGASPSAAARVYCRDGAWVSSTSACGTHGGVERDMSSAGQK